jgi:hypothetical protein
MPLVPLQLSAVQQRGRAVGSKRGQRVHNSRLTLTRCQAMSLHLRRRRRQVRRRRQARQARQARQTWQRLVQSVAGQSRAAPAAPMPIPVDKS